MFNRILTDFYRDRTYNLSIESNISLLRSEAHTFPYLGHLFVHSTFTLMKPIIHNSLWWAINLEVKTTPTVRLEED